ncbi:DUF554 domain-containing protein [Vermiculatibacterium agrestimuris]|uniref:DUF554 domain-containing protein n=1 Tax=Vermiculatibacterium agrestimuris TaxID=2941519 RepID=UPI002040C679|nr:DUF554 domain-containing protein [Vermiculatibacterium agrestimuris]
MIAVFINVVLVLAGSILGLLLKNRFSQRLGDAVVKCLALCTFGIGASSLLGTQNTLCVIVCMALGTLLGEWIDIEKRLDGAGEALKKRLIKDGSSGFVEGFVTATILYCVGAMAINGSIEAGLNHSYGVLISKSVLDGISSITFAAAMGVGVTFSTIPIFVYEGALVLLAGAVGPYLGEAVVTEMSAVGGAIIVGIAINMMGLSESKFRVGNMLPAIFLPILYLPLSQWLGSLMA